MALPIPGLADSRIAREAARLAPSRGRFAGLFSDSTDPQPSPREFLRPRYDNAGRRISIFDDGVDTPPSEPPVDPQPERPIARMAKRLNSAYDAASEFIAGPKQALDLGVGLGTDYLKRRGLDLGIDTGKGNEAGQLARKIPNVLSGTEAYGNAVFDTLPGGIGNVGKAAQEGLAEKVSGLLTDPMMALVPEHKLAAAAFLPGIVKGAGEELGQAGASALEGDYAGAARHAAGGLVDTGFSILGGLHAGGPRRIEAAAARLAEEKARAANAPTAEAAVAAPPAPGEFRLPEAQPLVPEERPFAPPQPDIYEGVDLGVPHPPPGPGFQPEAPPVDALAEREFLTPDLQALTAAEQARLLRLSRQEAPPLTSAIQAALAGEPGAPRLAPPPIGPDQPAEIPGLGTDFTVSPEGERILRGRMPAEEPQVPLPVQAPAAEPLAAAPPTAPIPPPEPPPAAAAAPVEAPRPPLGTGEAARAASSVREEAAPAIQPSSLGDRLGSLSERGGNRGEVATPAAAASPVPTGPAVAAPAGVPQKKWDRYLKARSAEVNTDPREYDAFRKQLKAKYGDSYSVETITPKERARLASLKADWRRVPVPPKDSAGNPIIPGQEDWTPQERSAARSHAENVLREIEQKGRSQPVGARGVVDMRGAGSGDMTGQGYSVTSHKTGTAFEGLPYEPAEMRQALKTDKGNPIEQDVLDAAGRDYKAMEEERGGPAPTAEQPRGPERRQQAVHPVVERRLVERREAIATEKPHLQPADVEDLAQAQVAQERHRLTGLPERELFDKAVAEGRYGAYASADGRAFGILNKTHGHVAGDAIIKAMADIIHEAVRPLGVDLFHTGGDEFRLGGKDLNAVRKAAEAAQADLFGATIEHVGPDGKTSTIELPEVDFGYGTRFEDADAELGAIKLARKRGAGSQDADPELGAAEPGAVASKPPEGREPDASPEGRSDVPAVRSGAAPRAADQRNGPDLGAGVPRSEGRPGELAAPPQYSVRPAPGQRGIPGLGEDVAPPREKAKKPEQSSMFGGEMLQASEARTTEGREGEGALFTQERDARERGQAGAQAGLFATEERAAEARPSAPEGIADFGEKIGGARKDTARPLGPRRAEGTAPADDRPAWQRPYRVFQDAGELTRQGEAAPWRIARGDKLVYRSGRESTFKTRAEAEQALPLMEVSRNHRVGGARDGSFGIYRQITDRKNVLVRGGFESTEAARKYMAANPEEIISHKFPFPEKPWLDHIDRTGPEYRQGDVRPVQFQEAFGFRGGEFGNWNMGSDGQAALNHAYDGLMDLARTLGVPPKALSLDGKLAIAFGARGHGGKDSARAHYEPDRAVINLTKIKGAGSLAHEWFHALDHYLSNEAGGTSLEGVSHGFPRGEKARPELKAAFERVMREITASEKTQAVEGDSAAKFSDRMSESVDRVLREIRSSFTYEPYNKRMRKPTPEELARFDELAERIKGGDVGERKVIEGKGRFNFRRSYEPIEELNALYKSVRGNSFATADEGSRGRQLAASVDSMLVARGRVEAAKAGATETKRGASDFLRNSRDIDQYRASDYWSTPHEMAARAFEAYAYDKLRGATDRSDYLTHSVENKDYAGTGMKPYPEGVERQAINKAFDGLFETIKTKETDKGTALYRATVGGEAGGLTLADVRKHIRAPGITETPEGFQFRVGQTGVRIDRVGDIHLEPKAFESGRPGQSPEGLQAVGSYQRVGDLATIKLLAKEGETPRTLLHEAWHLVKDLGLLREGELKAIEKKYGANEEAQADAYADWNPKTRPDGIFSRIASYFRNIYRAFRPSAESAFERVRGGEVFGTPDRPAPAENASAVEAAAARVEQSPSPAQMANGNYAKGHVKWNGLDIALETPKGGTRTAKDGSWSVEDYPAHYGYVKRTIGSDGDHVDVFMGDKPASDRVWVIDQKNKAGTFDEHKALVGFPSKDEAIQAYRDAYKGDLADKLLGDVTEMSADGFKEWVREGDTKKPLGGDAPKYATAPKMPPQIRPIPPKAGPVSVPPTPASAGAAKNPAQAFTLPEETLVDAAARTFQDKLRRLEVVEGAVGKQGGKVRPAGENVKAAADALGAKVAAQHERIRDEYVEPLTKILGEKKVPLSDLDDYMAILHAPDRDAAIAKRTDGKVKEGSGWTAAERTKRFSELEQKYGQAQGGNKIAALEPAADIVRKMRDEQLRILQDGGLLSKEQIKGWKAEMGDNYVPFRTIEAQEGIGTGQGFDIRGKESKSATGRSTKADSPVTFMLQQLYRSTVRAAKNKVDQLFAEFVRDNKLFEMDKDHTRTELGPDGKVRTVVDALRAQQDFTYKVDGETHRIDIASVDPLLDRAMRNMSSQERNIVVDHLGSLTRRFSQLVTSRNPSFVLPNFVRDVQQAVTSIGVEHGADVAKNALKGMGPALKEMFRAARDPKKASQMAREFKQDGGAVGWYQVKNVAELEKDLTGRIRDVHAGAARRVWRSMWDGIDSVNHSIENATRFATYKALRDAGASREKAATAARNVTVDFTKKGEAGPTINALYAFFNAGVQGSKRMKEVLIDSPRGRALAASMVASGMAMDAYNRAMAGDDNEDGTNDYDAIPEYVKSRNWVVMRGEGKKPLLVPLPHGLNVLHTTGRQIMGALQGATTPGQAAMSVVGSAANALNPLGGDSDLVQMLSPTFLDPFVQHATNRTWSGRPLKPETFPGAAKKPESEMFFKNAPPAAIAIARWLNDHTGGDKVTPGLISVSPEVLSLYADAANSYLTGGLGKDIVKTSETAKSLASGEPPSIRNVPVAGRFVYEESPGQQSQRFRENDDELTTLWQRYKTYRQEGDIESIKTLPMSLLKAKRTFDAIDHRIQALRRAAKARPELEKQIEDLQIRANRLVANAKRAAKQA